MAKPKRDTIFDYRLGIPILEAAQCGQFLYDFMLRGYHTTGLTHGEFITVLHFLAYHYNTPKGQSRPSLSTVANEMGIEADRVSNILASIENKGMAKIIRRPGLTSIYSFEPLVNTCLHWWWQDQFGEPFPTPRENTSGSENTTTPPAKTLDEAKEQSKQYIGAILPPSQPVPVQGRQRRQDKMARKLAAASAAEQLAGLPPEQQDKATAYLTAFLQGRADVSGSKATEPDAQFIIENAAHVLGVNGGATPDDYRQAVAYYCQMWGISFVTPKSISGKLSIWLADGKPHAKIVSSGPNALGA